MRTLVKSNRYTITGDRTIAVTYYEFTAQDIRLIYNETQDEILVSSGLKIGVVVENGIITLSENTPIMNVNDILTIEIDSVQNCEGLSIEMNEGKARIANALTIKGQNSTAMDTYEQLAQKTLAITGDVTVIPLDGWNPLWHDLAYEVSQWNDALNPYAFAILLEPSMTQFFLSGADKYKISDGRILEGAQTITFGDNELGRESKTTKYVIFRTSTPYFSQSFGSYPNIPVNRRVFAAYNYGNDWSAISFDGVRCPYFINDISVKNPIIFGSDRKLLTLTANQFRNNSNTRFTLPPYAEDATEFEKLTLVIPDNFMNNSSISDFNFQNNVKNITLGVYAFAGCSGLNTFIFPFGVETITMNGTVFQACSNLVSLILPSSLKSFIMNVGQNNTFNGCSSLIELVFPSGLETISFSSGSAFIGCTSFTRLYMPKSLQTVSLGGLSTAPSLTNIELEAGWDRTANVPNSTLTPVNVKNNMLDSLVDKRGDGVNATTASMTTASPIVTFTNGNCLNVFRAGDTITLVGGTVRTILTVDNANQITLTSNGSHNLNNVAYDMNRTLTLTATVKTALATAYGAAWANAYTAKGWTIA